MSPEKDTNELVLKIANGDMRALAQVVGRLEERMDGIQKTVDTVDSRTAKMQSDLNDLKVTQSVDHQQIISNKDGIINLGNYLNSFTKDIKSEITTQLEKQQERNITWAWLVDKFGPPIITGVIVAVVVYLAVG